MNGPSWLWTYLRHVFSGALRACVVDWSDDRAPPGAGCTDPGDRRLPRRRRHRELPVAGGCLLRGDDRLDEGPATAAAVSTSAGSPGETGCGPVPSSC